jgi:hypothetical protein
MIRFYVENMFKDNYCGENEGTHHVTGDRH